MSATPFNANLRAPDKGKRERSQTAANYAPGREALQALLAFSSLHEQIRRRRVHQALDFGRPAVRDVWSPEDFVLDEVLQLVSERALAITGSDGVAIALAEGDDIRCRAAAGRLGPGPGARLDPSSGFSGACFRTGLIVRCDDTEKDPRVDREICRRMGLRSMVAVPLMTESGVIGLLEAFCSEAYGFNDGDVRGLTLLAELILAALKPEEDLPPERAFGESIVGDVLAPEAISAEGDSAQNQPAAAQAQTPAVVEKSELPHLDAVRDVLAPVTENSRQVQPEPVKDAPGLFSQYPAVPAEPGKSRGWLIALLVVLVVLAATTGAGYWWWNTHQPRPAAITRAQQAPTVTPTPAQPAPPQATENPPAAPEADEQSAKEGALPQVTAIRHWSSPDSSTVVVDLQKQVQYEAHRLTDPERIYFDLHDTSLAPGLVRDFEVGDALLVRIRIAQPAPGITRVVLETKDSPNFSVSLETNPYRLMVEVRSISAKPKSSRKIDLFAPSKPAPLEHYAMNRGARRTSAWQEPPATPSAAENTVAGMPKFRIVLDAGHGGWDMGTVGRSGLLEKDLVLDVVARLGKLVSKHLGAEVIYTRHDDSYISLERRTEVANLAQADLFVSIHANYSDLPTARGVETYYTKTYSSLHARSQGPDDPQAVNVDWSSVNIREKVQESRQLASDVQQALYHGLAAKNPLVRNRGVKEASYAVLTGTTMPAVLAEVSFVSSPTDETKLQNAAYREEIAEALFKGISAYAEKIHHVNMASARVGAGQ